MKNDCRVRARNEELEHGMEILKQEVRQLEEDRADVVAHLELVLRQKIEEANELSERLAALEELRKEEQIAFKKREAALEMEYRNMENTLSAEIKLAAGKLNALEDWRTARIELLRKFEIQEERMTEQEERHKRLLYEAEKELIINKARMKKEMEERLMQLAQNFRDATNIRIADATHRAIRENIALNKELDAMLQVCRDLDTKTKQCKEKHRTLKLQASLYENEAKMALNKTLKQNRTIEKLAKDHYKMTLECGKLQRAEAKVRHIEQLAQEYKDKCRDVEEKVRILEQHTQQAKYNENEVMKELSSNCEEIQRLSKILREARQCVAEVLKIQAGDAYENICTACYPNVKERLLCSLLEILGKEQTGMKEESQIKHSKYTLGDLGLVPSRITNECQLTLEPEEFDREQSQARSDDDEKLEENILNSADESFEENIRAEAEEDAENLITIPSCLLSDPGSSDLPSPLETISDPSLKNIDTNM
ncbi:cilia- and flagella-associated protein 157 isoform X1 [Athalia rosae]|uniref:cilia- and flagella-associated protein 157 isoform X1 n=1 Tax=Athalia rosae TaxID=37344 RepID=UPI0020333F95|nr:cilia- and flagella-associated protein 157 isoform X1 [Athalia rosae]